MNKFTDLATFRNTIRDEHIEARATIALDRA